MPDGLDAVEASLRRRFRVVATDVRVGGRDLSILHPESAEDLIDALDFDRDERLPYWAELWPSSLVLAEHVIAMRGGRRPLLELGCGSGLVATSAAMAGFDVVVSDYYEDAVRFARVNAARNARELLRGLVLDWRHLPRDVPRFDVVLASDVLYERPYGPLVARTIAATLGDDGMAVVADPGRVGRDDFLEALKPAGLVLTARIEQPFHDGQVHQTITLFEITRPS